jgi:hypothetical protein
MNKSSPWVYILGVAMGEDEAFSPAKTQKQRSVGGGEMRDEAARLKREQSRHATQNLTHRKKVTGRVCACTVLE